MKRKWNSRPKFNFNALGRKKTYLPDGFSFAFNLSIRGTLDIVEKISLL